MPVRHKQLGAHTQLSRHLSEDNSLSNEISACSPRPEPLFYSVPRELQHNGKKNVCSVDRFTFFSQL